MKDGIVLIMTNKTEAGVDKVASFLQDLGQRYIRINTDSFLEENNDLSIFHSEEGLSVSSQKGGFRVEVSDIKSVWYRRSKIPRLVRNPCEPNGRGDEFLKTEWQGFFWSVFTN